MGLEKKGTRTLGGAAWLMLVLLCLTPQGAQARELSLLGAHRPGPRARGYTWGALSSRAERGWWAPSRRDSLFSPWRAWR